MNILGIESSCDETAAAIIEDGKTILSNVVASSAVMHQKYGGIVPEVAARKQLESIIPVLTEALQHASAKGGQAGQGLTKDDIDAIAVTVGPGLIGSLLVGVETAKTLSLLWNKPLIPVNHVLAHPYAAFLNSDKQQVTSDKKIEFPAIALVVSGGHTELYLMQNEKEMKWLGGTTDDAAGECFDKCARLLDLPYPGGPAISIEAEKFHKRHPERSEGSSAKTRSYASLDSSASPQNDMIIKLPRPMMYDNSLNFSFSGLKTAVLREVNKVKMKPFDPVQGELLDNFTIQQFSHEIQESITDVLVTKTLKAVNEYEARSIIVSGGVAANKRLTQKMGSQLTTLSVQPSLHVPPPKLCVDSATFIATYAYYHFDPKPLYEITARPDLEVEI